MDPSQMYNPEANNQYMYMMMNHSREGMFNHQINYNPFFMNNITGVVNPYGASEYQAAPFINQDYGVIDYIKRNVLGVSRNIGYNGIQAELASSQQHNLMKAQIGDLFTDFATDTAIAGVGSRMGLPGIIGAAAFSIGRDVIGPTVADYYTSTQKANLITSNMLNSDGINNGFSAKDIISIQRKIKSLAANDDLMGEDDIQELMAKVTKFGLANNITSGQEFKNAISTIKDRVKTLAEFMGETDPSKILPEIAKFKSLGFNIKQSFDVSQMLHTASEFSGLNKETLTNSLGYLTSTENPLSLDRRALTRSFLSQSTQLNYLIHGAGSSKYITNKPELLNTLMAANQKADIALNQNFGQDINRDEYLAEFYSKAKGISLQKAYDEIQLSSVDERQKILNQASKVKGFSFNVYHDKDLVARHVQENASLGGLKQRRTSIQVLIDKMFKQYGEDTSVERIMQGLKDSGGFNASELSSIQKLVVDRAVYGSFNREDSVVRAAEFKNKTGNLYTQLNMDKNYHGAWNTVKRFWENTKLNVGASIFGNRDTGEAAAAQTIEQQLSMHYSGSNESFRKVDAMREFAKETKSYTISNMFNSIKKINSMSKIFSELEDDEHSQDSEANFNRSLSYYALSNKNSYFYENRMKKSSIYDKFLEEYETNNGKYNLKERGIILDTILHKSKKDYSAKWELAADLINNNTIGTTEDKFRSEELDAIKSQKTSKDKLFAASAISILKEDDKNLKQKDYEKIISIAKKNNNYDDFVSDVMDETPYFLSRDTFNKIYKAKAKTIDKDLFKEKIAYLHITGKDEEAAKLIKSSELDANTYMDALSEFDSFTGQGSEIGEALRAKGLEGFVSANKLSHKEKGVSKEVYSLFKNLSGEARKEIQYTLKEEGDISKNRLANIIDSDSISSSKKIKLLSQANDLFNDDFVKEHGFKKALLSGMHLVSQNAKLTKTYLEEQLGMDSFSDEEKEKIEGLFANKKNIEAINKLNEFRMKHGLSGNVTEKDISLIERRAKLFNGNKEDMENFKKLQGIDTQDVSKMSLVQDKKRNALLEDIKNTLKEIKEDA